MDTNIRPSNERILIPPCSIDEETGLVTVRMEMPGVSKEGLDVSVEANTLTVSGTRNPVNIEGTWLLRERPYGRYEKTFTLDDTIDREKIHAELVDGMLIIKLHIQEAAKPRKIEIR
jgi:HSP20 family protein